MVRLLRAGLAVTLLAGLLPALAASRVVPLEALRPTIEKISLKRMAGLSFWSGIVMIPRIPPVSTTQIFGDIATATRIESMAKTMSVSSTLTTVAQNAERPSQDLAAGKVRRSCASPPPKKCLYGR